MTGHLTAADLGLDMATDEGLFGWFVASLLFGRPVQQTVAANTWKLFQQDGYTTPESFIEAGSSVIDHELWQGKYRHLVGVMAEELPRVMKDLTERYGSVAALVAGATSLEDLTARLESFKGVGPKTAEIFIRELPDADDSQDN